VNASIDSRLEPTARTLVEDLVLAADTSLVAVCVHGSAVLGDFVPARSDLDVLIVIEDDVGPVVLERITAVLASDRQMAASGLEASVVAQSAAASPAPPWPFFVHVTTAPEDRKVVSGRTQSGDPDLVLHYAVARERGWSATGPPPTELFGSLPTSGVLAQIVDELRWAARNASASYAVLNACRALCYSFEGRICSKSQGGEWALARGIEPKLVAGA
jgi:streptomycin 3"-adenylyltransferase